MVCNTFKIIYWVNHQESRIEIMDVFDTRQDPRKIKRTQIANFQSKYNLFQHPKNTQRFPHPFPQGKWLSVGVFGQCRNFPKTATGH